jgi:hypothetical protein
MEQHPIPRQITTFEFKLIGFLTLKQFIYLLVFSIVSYVIYQLFPIPLLNIFFALLVGGSGLVLALVPIYDRPADVWIKNIYKRLTSPTQFIYKKNNSPISFFNHLYFLNDPHRVLAHIESQEKLAAYLAKIQAKNQTTSKLNQYNVIKQQLSSGVVLNQKSQSTSPHTQNTIIISNPVHNQVLTNNTQNQNQPTSPSLVNKDQPLINKTKMPFLTGVVKNHRQIPLPGILIYIKDINNNKILRLLKSNPHGVFASFNPLPEGDYQFEIKDPKGSYIFDTMKINLKNNNPKPLEFFSKELI